jgi:Kdo2-lipid IVA lauroyltransferase/acyltransferase
MARFILGHRLNAWGVQNPRAERLLYRLDRLFFDVLLALARIFPVDAASRFAGAVAASLAPRFKKSSAMLENLQIAFPEKSARELDRIVHQCWSNAGAVCAEYAHLEHIFSDAEGERLQIDISDAIETFKNPRQCAIFVAAHQANWELIGAAIVRHGVPLSCVYSPATNPLLDELLGSWRRRLGCELLPSEDSMRPMLRALSAGRSLGIVIDRRIDNGKDVQFFGHPKPTSIVPARLAIRYDCPLVPTRVERLHGSRFRVSFLPPIVPDVRAGDETAQAIDMTQRVHNLFEQWIREQPGQWFCSKRLWPKEVYRNMAHAKTGIVESALRREAVNE